MSIIFLIAYFIEISSAFLRGDILKNYKVFLYGIFCFIYFLMVFINLPSFVISPIVFLINVGIISVCALIIYFLSKSCESYIKNSAETVRNFLSSESYKLMDSLPVPTAVISKEDPEKIIFYNKNFAKEFCRDNYFVDEYITSYTSGRTADDLLKEGVQIKYNDKFFNVNSAETGEFIICFFYDITSSKIFRKKFIDTRPCVGFVMFDNKEELRQEVNDEKSSMISIMVENELQQWIKGAEGIFKKLNDGKYFVMFEEKYLKEFISDKFKILNKIHDARLDEHRYATISIGISRGASNLEEAAQWAKSALSMSLGRGGDQVSINRNNEYEFFGGNSQGLEKRSKVRTRVVAMALMEKIKSSESIFIMGHKFSDFDSVGAAIGIWSACCALKKKKCHIVVDKNKSMAGTSIDHFRKSVCDGAFIYPADALSMMDENSLLIVVDTHSLKFLESIDVYNKTKHVVVIDHHRMSVDKIKNAIVFFHEPFASSACEMVTELVQYMGSKVLNKTAAECLLAGIMLDTKNFSLKSGIRTFEAAAYLKKNGADNAEVKKMFANTIDMYKLRCKIMETAQTICECAIAKLEDQSKDFRIPCSQAADELLNIKNIKASFVISKFNEVVNISARSLGEVNVQVIMEKLGGGGHYNMSAAQLHDISIEDAEKKLISIIEESLS
ncbi:MAG: DHH family phosphoesterase [Acutalibacteraceae bacterium]